MNKITNKYQFRQNSWRLLRRKHNGYDAMGTMCCESKSETKHSWMNLKERDNVGSGFLPTTPVWESKNISERFLGNISFKISKNILERFLKILFGKSQQAHNSCPDLPAWKRLSSCRYWRMIVAFLARDLARSFRHKGREICLATGCSVITHLLMRRQLQPVQNCYIWNYLSIN